jgi:hypothetical protein
MQIAIIAGVVLSADESREWEPERRSRVVPFWVWWLPGLAAVRKRVVLLSRMGE